MTKWQHILLWTSLGIYVVARICQLYADKLPTLLIVILHVAPPAVFALIHGSILYRVRGFLIFAVCCLGIGGLSESLSLRTGIPFGHYYFTSVMGPKILGLPILLVLAYLGIGYCSWVLALLILGYIDKPLEGGRTIIVPIIAGFIMLTWDLSMEADWSTVDRAWIWRDGGPIYGVPVSNFFGWYLTSFLFFQVFALYCKHKVKSRYPTSPSYWRAAILLYAVCAFGNLLILRLPMAPSTVIDSSGRQWVTAEILFAGALISCLAMGPIALFAWLRLRLQESR